MSASMSWDPVIEQPTNPLSDRVRYLLEDEYFDGETERELDRDHVPFLRGVMAAIADREDEQDLKEMIEAIEKHGAVRIWLQY